ncbi:LysR family transcriptional regulator [Pseudoalteromonas sp. SaAl2]
MDLKILRSFVSVATHKSFSAAARELHTVQPAISRHIGMLEADLHVTLFVRNSREVNITSAGEQLLKDAKHILALTEQAKSQVKQAQNGQVGTLRIGYLSSACLSFMASLVREYKHQYPNVHVSLFEMTASDQVSAFKDDLIDIGFSRPLPQEVVEGFTSHEIYTDRLVAVVPKYHPLWQNEEAQLQQLSNDKFILFNREEAVGLFDDVISLCKRAEFSPNIVSQPRHMQTLLTEVSAGLGIAIAPYCIRKLFHEGCYFLQLSDIEKAIPTQLQFKNTQLSTTVAEFVSITLKNKAVIKKNME